MESKMKMTNEQIGEVLIAFKRGEQIEYVCGAGTSDEKWHPTKLVSIKDVLDQITQDMVYRVAPAVPPPPKIRQYCVKTDMCNEPVLHECEHGFYGNMHDVERALSDVRKDTIEQIKQFVNTLVEPAPDNCYKCLYKIQNKLNEMHSKEK